MQCQWVTPCWSREEVTSWPRASRARPRCQRRARHWHPTARRRALSRRRGAPSGRADRHVPPGINWEGRSPLVKRHPVRMRHDLRTSGNRDGEQVWHEPCVRSASIRRQCARQTALLDQGRGGTKYRVRFGWVRAPLASRRAGRLAPDRCARWRRLAQQPGPGRGPRAGRSHRRLPTRWCSGAGRRPR